MPADIIPAMNYVNTLTLAQSATGYGQPYNIANLPSNGNISWAVKPTGTVSTITLLLEGSLDGVNWYTLDTIAQGDTAGASGTAWSGTAGELKWMTGRQVNYLRSNLTVISGGGSITAQFSLFEPNR
jgi:hypothetical protein